MDSRIELRRGVFYIFNFFIICTVVVNGAVLGRVENIDDLICNDLPSGSKFLHPEFCNVYMMCEDDEAIQMICDEGVLFNPSTNDCDPEYDVCPSELYVPDPDDEDEDLPTDWENSAEITEEPNIPERTTSTTNTPSPSPPPPPTTTTTSPTTKFTEDLSASPAETIKVDLSSESTTNAATTTYVTNPDIIICPEIDSEQVIFLSHAVQCSIYYLCYHGKPIPFECSLGLHWSQKTKRCAPPEVADCQVRNAQTYPDCPTKGLEFLPHPNSCQHFMFCQNGIKSLQQCEPFYHWDINERRCKLKSTATCYQNLKQQTNFKL